jgi:putative phosphoesterase
MRYPCKRKKAYFCRFMSETLLPLTNTLNSNLKNIGTAEDIDKLKNCRVTTRQLRIALALFEPCFSRKKIKFWDPVLKNLTKSLNEVRDLDVQIAFIECLLQNGGQNSSSSFFFQSSTVLINHPNHHESQVISDHTLCSIEEPVGFSLNQEQIYQIGLECLHFRLKQKRIEIQEQVISTSCQTSESKIIDKIITELHGHSGELSKTHHPDEQSFAHEQLCYYIIRRIDDLKEYSTYLDDSTAHLQHHKMQIIAMKISFALEIFSGICYECLKPETEKIKQILVLLESLYDCDVWIDFLPRFLKDEKNLAIDYAGNTKLFDLITLGLLKLIDDQKTARELIFKEIVQTWATYIETDLFEEIIAKISILNNPVLQEEKIGELIPNLKIACISDIHANLPALEAVITDATIRGVTCFLNAGDCIGYGASPDQVIDVVRSGHMLSVIGNYDLDIITKKWGSRKVKSNEKKITMQWTNKVLSNKNNIYLRNLPKMVRLKIQGKKVLITHGSPESLTEYLTSETPYRRFYELATSSRTDIMITGHSHSPFLKEVAGTSFVNCGSVGRQEDRDPRASYALITFNPFSIILIRVPYNINKAVTKIRKNHLPKEFEQMAIMGCSLKSAKTITKKRSKK